MEGAFNDVVVRLMHGASEADVIARLDRLLGPNYGGAGAIPRAQQASNWYLANELTQLRASGLITPVIFLGVAAFLLNVVLNRVVAVQRTQIAAIKALGYSDAAIASHYVKWSLVGGGSGVDRRRGGGGVAGLGVHQHVHAVLPLPGPALQPERQGGGARGRDRTWGGRGWGRLGRAPGGGAAPGRGHAPRAARSIRRELAGEDRPAPADSRSRGGLSCGHSSATRRGWRCRSPESRSAGRCWSSGNFSMRRHRRAHADAVRRRAALRPDGDLRASRPRPGALQDAPAVARRDRTPSRSGRCGVRLRFGPRSRNAAILGVPPARQPQPRRGRDAGPGRPPGEGDRPVRRAGGAARRGPRATT